jgi:hypothetical protein
MFLRKNMAYGFCEPINIDETIPDPVPWLFTQPLSGFGIQSASTGSFNCTSQKPSLIERLESTSVWAKLKLKSTK